MDSLSLNKDKDKNIAVDSDVFWPCYFGYSSVYQRDISKEHKKNFARDLVHRSVIRY